MSIRDSMLRKDAKIVLSDGTEFTASRPSALDLIEAIEYQTKHPESFGAWLVFRHLKEDGKPVFNAVDEVINDCDAFMVLTVASHIEQLYNEGKA